MKRIKMKEISYMTTDVHPAITLPDGAIYIVISEDVVIHPKEDEPHVCSDCKSLLEERGVMVAGNGSCFIINVCSSCRTAGLVPFDLTTIKDRPEEWDIIKEANWTGAKANPEGDPKLN